MLVKKIISGTIISLFFSICAHADTVLQNIHGEKIPFASLAGKWVFINYWASWCQPCLDEIPELNRFYEQHKKNNIAMFAVNYDAMPVNEQKLLIQQFDIRYPTLKHDPARLLHLGDINGVPVTFVFNPQGQLVDRLTGGQTLASLNEVLASN